MMTISQLCLILILSFVLGAQSQDTTTPVSGDVRLAGGNETAGRVEVYYRGEWGTVCDNGWDIEDAHIVCIQLGFPGALSAIPGAAFGEGTGPVQFEYVGCFGGEANLGVCSRSSTVSCDHSQDAGVSCLEGSAGGPGMNCIARGADECRGQHDICTDTESGFNCTCEDRFERRNGICVGISCEEAGEHACGENEMCIGAGPYFCFCNDGYVKIDGVCQALFPPTLPPSLPSLSPATCEPIRSSLCGNMPYNMTVFPNLAGFTTQEEAEEILSLTFGAVIPVGCSAGFFQFMCLQFFAPCESTGVPTIPCRELCETSFMECVAKVSASGLTIPLPEMDCSVLPAEETGICFAGDPSRFPYELGMTSQSPSPPTCEPLQSSRCRNMPYNMTVFPNLAGLTTQEEADGILSLTFGAVIPVGCSAGFFQFMCLQFMPPCESTGVSTIPCRELCETSFMECLAKLNASGVAISPLNMDCSVLPAEETGLCFAGDPSIFPYDVALNCTPACGESETCADVDGSSSCVCLNGYIRVAGVCQVKTCANFNCGSQSECVGNDTVFYNCECNNFSFKEGDICVDKTCGNSKVCSGPGDSCEDHYISYMCFCGENRTHNEDQSDCVDKTCENSNVCSGPGDQCNDHHLGYMCECGQNRTLNEDQSDCVAKTCANSCNGEGEYCTEENGYSCTCREGYTRPAVDWPCQKNVLPTRAGTSLPTETPMVTETPMATDTPMPTETPMATETPMPTETVMATEMPTETPMPAKTSMTTDTPLPTETLMTSETPMPTEPSGGAESTEPRKTEKPEKTTHSTESSKPGDSTKSTATPDGKKVGGHHSYTGAIVGLFIFLMLTCLVFVAVYLVRRRKLRHNYGRMDEDNEGEGGWSAFSKNPIYRGDRDYQLL